MDEIECPTCGQMVTTFEDEEDGAVERFLCLHDMDTRPTLMCPGSGRKMMELSTDKGAS